MNITVILCTYNRCRSLVKALDSAAALSVPAAVDWEVLVVDNNSSDGTREVVEDFCRRFPEHFRYFFEPRPGKSHALNSGIQEARGDILAFMDDDVIVEPEWLRNLTAPLEDIRWAGSGGRILPDPSFSPPRWMPLEGASAVGYVLALFDQGANAGPLREPPFGTNMAFRKVMFEKYGGFRTDLGPRPDSEIRNEDTEFGRRLMTEGEWLRYEPSAVVYHPVPPNRMRKKYFLDWYFGKGQAEIREFGMRPQTSVCWRGISFRMLRSIVFWTLRWMTTVEPRLRFRRKMTVWGKAGEILECYRQTHEGRTKRECSART